MPMKPPGKPLPKPEDPARKAGKSAAKDAGAAGPAEDASAAARIERSRRTVTEQVAETQQRIQKAAVLSILSGKGPATSGVTTSRARARGRSLVDFGGLDANLADLEGLTKFDSKLDANNDAAKDARRRDEGVGAMTGIDKMVKGFQNAKVGAASKIGVMELEKPELLERNSKYTGDRSMADVGVFISKKQSMINLMYEEKLKVDPTLEGKITVVLVIEEDGRVSSATVLRSETTLNDPDFQADLLRRIKRWIFPPSTGGPVEMKSPFVFKPA
jgi:TonB family protein